MLSQATPAPKASSTALIGKYVRSSFITAAVSFVFLCPFTRIYFWSIGTCTVVPFLITLAILLSLSHDTVPPNSSITPLNGTSVLLFMSMKGFPRLSSKTTFLPSIVIPISELALTDSVDIPKIKATKTTTRRKAARVNFSAARPIT
ncbi:hypothetical protein SDC9_141392 [bioreactor metagenome]|uniref:Uncharacterized protein n=1 Tax=bioreactor metagenome TaxID=1076179 RepID=A0A645DY29_9ZZZZ